MAVLNSSNRVVLYNTQAGYPSYGTIWKRVICETTITSFTFLTAGSSFHNSSTTAPALFATYHAGRLIFPQGMSAGTPITLYTYSYGERLQYLFQGIIDRVTKSNYMVSVADTTLLCPDTGKIAFLHKFTGEIEVDILPGGTAEPTHYVGSFFASQVMWQEADTNKFVYGQVVDNISGQAVKNALITLTRE